MTFLDTLWSELRTELLPVFADYRERIADLPVEVKSDQTLLTQADIAIQKLIIEAIRSSEPNAVVIAEEDERIEVRSEVLTSSGRVWVVDPIDGTAEFVRPDRNEFCSVIALLEDWVPSAAFILAPELAVGRTPLMVTADVANHSIGGDAPLASHPQNVMSMTRSKESEPRLIEGRAGAIGVEVKTRTTSQSLDMLRTVLDISGLTDPPLRSFDLFFRREQKLWDGAAGLVLGRTAGLRDCDEDGNPLPFVPQFLSDAAPVFPSTLMGYPEAVDWFLGGHT